MNDSPAVLVHARDQENVELPALLEQVGLASARRSR